MAPTAQRQNHVTPGTLDAEGRHSGDPPYVMADDIELTFLRKFIERQASGIPHNPRLRNSMGETGYTIRDDHSVDSGHPALLTTATGNTK